MRPRFKFLILLAAAGLLLFLPAVYLLGAKQHSANHDPVTVLTHYLRALYSRDFRLAYRFIAAPDQHLKSERVYVRERGPFSGFTLEVARKLAQLIEFTPAEVRKEGNRARVMLGFKAPDMNSLGPLLLDWDEEQLNALPLNQQKKIIDAIDKLKQTGKLEMIEGQEQFALVKEGGHWRMFFDWASGVTVKFSALVPQDGLLEAKPTIRETVTRPNELFTISYRVKNLTDKDLLTRISHRVEPDDIREHLDLVECALLLPVKIPAGEEQTYSSTYVVRGDIPEGTKHIEVTYEFKIEG